MGLFSKKERDDFSIRNGVCTVTFVGKKKLTKKRADGFYLSNKEIADCQAINVIIGEGTAVIAADAFSYEYKHVESVTIPSSVTTIGERAFTAFIQISSFNVDEGNQNYKSIDGDLYTKDGKVLIAYARGKGDKVFTIPDGVTTIGNSAFCGASLEGVVFPTSVKTIGNGAFFGAKLMQIDIPASVTSIGCSAFIQCENLGSVTIADGVTSIGDNAFRNCYPLQSITIPGSVVTIGDSAFSGCSSLKNVNILNGVKSIGYHAFDCSAYNSYITVPNSVERIGFGAISLYTVLCQAGKQPKGWHSQWKDSRCTVKWGWDMSGKQLND